MPYELILELARPTARRVVSEALDETPDARRFRAEPRARTWLGKVRSLALVLPFGGSREEAAAFARAGGALARRLGAALFDPQLGHGLPPGGEVDWVVDTWAEANLRALAGYERGWIVRPPEMPVEDGRAHAVEATRSDALPAGTLSVARAYLRAGAAAPARVLAERVLDDDAAGAAGRDEARALLRDVERLEALAGDAGRAALTRARPEPRDVPALVEALRDEATRAGAAAALAAIGPPALDALLAALADEDLRPGVAAALEEVGAPALPALARRLARGPRAEAAGALAVLEDLSALADGGAPEQARAGLAGQTEGRPPDDMWSREAGERLRRTHHTDGVVVDAAVARLLAEPDLDAPGLALWLERACAANAGAVRSVVRLLRDGPARHAGAAADALGGLGRRAGAEAAEALLARLVGPAHPDLDDDALARALAVVAPDVAGPRLGGALDVADEPERRARLLHALAEVAPTLAVPRLVEAVRRAAAADPSDLRPACPDDADFVLATWIRDPAALPAVTAALDDPLPAVRLALVGALASIGGDQARAALARVAAGDAHAEVRAAAVAATS